MINQYRGTLKDPEGIREMVLNSIGDFRDIKAWDGEAYKRVFPYHLHEVDAILEDIFGPIAMLGSGFRLNFGGEVPNNNIHVDEGWGTHALVLYLSTGPVGLATGTAFWLNGAEVDPTIPSIVVQEEFNKMVVYNSDTPHSRWPFEAYGNDPISGRLIYVAFFSIINDMEF